MNYENYTYEELIELLESYDNAYFNETPLVSDGVYDSLKEYLVSEGYKPKIGHTPNKRERKLPFMMMSLDKLKNEDELNKIFKKYSLTNEYAVLSPKLDGMSILRDELSLESFTRGDGEYGMDCSEHLKLLNSNIPYMGYTFGELMVSKAIFEKKYSQTYENSRNFVSSLIRRDEPSDMLKDLVYIRYGIFEDNYNKKDQLDLLNSLQTVKIPYHFCKFSEITNDLLVDLFTKWQNEYDIDGVVIDVNDFKLRNKLGRYNNGNPVYAYAYKGDFEEVKETEIIKMEWNISKYGVLSPVAYINPVRLDGATVSKVTVYNASWARDKGIGVGSKILIKRSGMVIPKIIDVLSPVEFQYPDIPYEYKWDKNNTHLVLKELSREMSIQLLTAFFKISKVENVSEGICTVLYDNGYKTIFDVLRMNIKDFESLPSFGERKAIKTFNSIQTVWDNKKHIWQHASSIFPLLGSKKLVKLAPLQNPTLEEIISMEGFSDITANVYLDNLSIWNEFEETIKSIVPDYEFEIEKELEVSDSDSFVNGKSVCFSGIRDKELEEIIKSKGGKIASGVSKNTHYLIVKELNSGTSKEVKAKELGIEIYTIDNFYERINTLR